jgi:twitching motility protein PilT
LKTIEEMLRTLARADVTEFAVVSDRLPCVKIDGAFQPIDDVAPDTDTLLQMLVSAGGSRYVDSLGNKPVQWSLRIEGVGMIGVSALLRDDIVQARFIVAKRDGAPLPPPSSRDRDDDGPTIQSLVQTNRPLRADIDPRARGSALTPPPPAPAAAAALVEAEPEFDLEDRAGISKVSHPRLNEMVLDETPGLALEMESVPPAAPPQANFSFAMTFDDLLAFARASNASDMHLVPDRPALLRIAGELLPRGPVLDSPTVDKCVASIIPERLLPQLAVEGSCDFAITDNHGRCRVNVSRQRTGVKICVRLIGNEIPTLASLGVPAEIEIATHHHQGLILVTGPTGHGKTSTLAAIVDILNTNTTHHIITVEDPVEYVHPRKRAMMSQREVGKNTKTFAAALKGSLREDPDVIVVGELRDTETVRMALSASETGHLVIGTMNTPSAAKTIDRVIDLFPPGDQAQVRLTLAGGLRLIVSQRLIPNSDRTGQVAAAEILPGSVSLWSLIRDNKTYQIPSLQQRGKGLGIIRFDDSLAELVKNGRTTLEIAKQWAENADELENTVRAMRKAPAPPPPPPKAAGAVAMDTLGSIMGKAGNLFRKGE